MPRAPTIPQTKQTHGKRDGRKSHRSIQSMHGIGGKRIDDPQTSLANRQRSRQQIVLVIEHGEHDSFAHAAFSLSVRSSRAGFWR